MKTGNHLSERDRTATALPDAGLTITARICAGFEADTGFHHYMFDVAVAASWD